jgi:hypothetical protein
VRVTLEPALKLWLHVLPQLIPDGLLVPVPLPEGFTVSSKELLELSPGLEEDPQPTRDRSAK